MVPRYQSLLSPPNYSANDGTSPSLCSLSYSSVDDAVHHIVRLGSGAMLAKFDLTSAYQVVPIHPQDRMLLGMVWNGGLYVDGALPIGLRSTLQHCPTQVSSRNPDFMNAPQLQWPDASDVSVKLGAQHIILPNSDTPFQSSRKGAHHCKSEWKSWSSQPNDRALLQQLTDLAFF